MNSRCEYELRSYLKEIREQYENQKKRLQQILPYASGRLKVNHHKDGKDYYYVYDHGHGTYKYLGSADKEEVRLIKEARFLESSTREMEREIRMIEQVLRLSRPIDYDTVNNKMRKVYRGAKLSDSPVSSELARKWKQYGRIFIELDSRVLLT